MSLKHDESYYKNFVPIHEKLMDLLKANYRDYHLGVVQIPPDAATAKLGAIDKVKIILDSPTALLVPGNQQLDNLAVEVKAQLEKSTVDDILSSPVLDYGPQWTTLLLETKPFEDQLSMSIKFICLILSQQCIEDQLKLVVLKQTE